MTFRVRFAETDQMGVAHHGAYVVWFEAARVEWMRERGLSYRDFEASGLSMAVAGLEIDYRAAARFDDLLHIDCDLTVLRSRRVAFRYRLVGEEGRLLAHARTVHVPTDRSGRAVRLPTDWTDALGPHVSAEDAATPGEGPAGHRT